MPMTIHLWSFDMLLDLADVHFPTHLRLRSETYGDIEGLADSMVRRGQLAPILVRKIDPESHEQDKDVEVPYVLIDGGRRYLAVALTARLKDNEDNTYLIDGNEPLTIEAKLIDCEHVKDERYLLEMEFHANEDREGFSWKEKATYYERIHEMFMIESEFDPALEGWSIPHTAKYLGVGESTLGKYLQFSEDPDIMDDDRVSGAKTFRTAYKQATIVRETRKRERQVKHHKKITTEGDEDIDDEERFQDFAMRLVAHEDCRVWIKEFLDDDVSWIHWDPPYGGEQDGGAFTSTEDIDDSPEYADLLLGEMLPELYRVLQPGRWMVLWFHPARYESTRLALETAGFWVNPYPCIWYKQDRNSDGHEITRYLTNAYETFFLCAKGDKPILQVSNRQNVFAFDTIPRSARRHIMHKPAEMLTEILRLISIPGEKGIDPSVGSGSIFEASLASGRVAFGCEISLESYLGALQAIKNVVSEIGVK